MQQASSGACSAGPRPRIAPWNPPVKVLSSHASRPQHHINRHHLNPRGLRTASPAPFASPGLLGLLVTLGGSLAASRLRPGLRAPHLSRGTLAGSPPVLILVVYGLCHLGRRPYLQPPCALMSPQQQVYAQVLSHSRGLQVLFIRPVWFWVSGSGAVWCKHLCVQAGWIGSVGGLLTAHDGRGKASLTMAITE